MKLLVITFFLSLLSHVISALDMQGIIRYQTEMQFPGYQKTLDDPSTSLKKRKSLENTMLMLRSMLDNTYTLTFNQYESLFEAEDKLTLQDRGGPASAPYGDYYKNFADNLYIQKVDVFGRIYLVSEELPKFDWKLHDGTKMIGKYLCRKATYTEEQELSEPVQREDGTFENKTVKKNVTTTAWYAPQIPIMNGPNQYGGLPGLIMEVSNDGNTYIHVIIRCIEVNLQPENEVKIKRPKGKRMVTEAELKSEIKRM